MVEVWIRRQRWRLLETRPGEGLVALGVSGSPGDTRRTFLTPCDAAVVHRPGRPRTVSRRQALARLAGHTLLTHPPFTPASLHDTSLDVLPYQLEPALAFCAGRRRLLIADAVGLGKTIQAGIVLHTVHGRDPLARSLVVAPGALLTQWARELHTRFGRTTRIADATSLVRLRRTLPYAGNPWLEPGIWLASPDYLKQPHVLDGLPDAPWSVIVFDEAHGLAGDSQRHAAMHALACRAHGVVLLTATPHDGDADRYHRLLSLGSRPDALTVFRRTRPVDPARRRLRRLVCRLGGRERRLLDAIRTFTQLRRSPAGLSLIGAVFSRRALSSPAAVARSIDRRLQLIDAAGPSPDPWHQPSLFDADVVDEEDDLALRAVSGLSHAHERSWLLRLRHLCIENHDAGRVRALVRLLRRFGEPVVIFTQYRDSQPAIARAVPPGRRVVCVHGGHTTSEQQHALDTFLSGRADTLVATDVASQGLNLHPAARWVISYDLPWTPLRLEQRIGRVDRLGQQRPVHATLLVAQHPVDHAALDRLQTRARTAADTTDTTCRRWTQAAAGLARWHDRQRRLRRAWRTPLAPTPCRAIVEPDRAMVCWDVVLADAAGVPVERRLVVSSADATADAVASALAPRVRALTARLRRREAVARRPPQADAMARQPALFGSLPIPGPIPGPVRAPQDAASAPAPRVVVARLHRVVEFVGRACASRT